MISITCTSCEAQLTIDDAFAGGVCRCQFCGAIQTVPSKASAARRPAAPQAHVSAGDTRSPKTLYTKKPQTQAAGTGTGLNDLADIVASSGLGSSGLGSSGLASSGLTRSGLAAGHNPRNLAIPPSTAPSKNKLMPVLIGAGAIIALLVGLIAWLAIHGHSTETPPAAASDNTAVAPAPAAVAPGPTCLGVPLPEPVVIYLLDRGQATRATFDAAKAAVLKSLSSLHSNQRFQVVFWKTKAPLAVYPPSGPSEASASEIEECRKAIDNVVAWDSSDVKPGMEQAMKSGAAVVVILSGKLLGDDFAKSVLDARKNNPVKVHCLSLAEPGSAAAMRQVAEKTGGAYRNISKEELSNFVR